ncbi:3' terminal RNA ribose 2'-O-methyltransferase Hen1 [Cytobacillus gottheilii]|uniref:3' terminal RNA ribose 2'-O-methyltransferase Hen1 n=1 Tax=Cytobacillus gottheilii TaxID=859144 RepID=UPI0008344F8B|nr:3' terminal RNA ribose 2'-O-methyltransferase Hen1 [Cytobacillus gottheilii]
MQLTLNAKGQNASVMSYLLAKNPNNIYERKQKGHYVRLFYSRFSEEETEVTIFVTPDPIELTKNSSSTYDITHYINDREFAVSSIFCSFIRTALGTALNGQPADEYKKWVDEPFDFQVDFGPIASSLSDKTLYKLFTPIGFDVLIVEGEANYQFELKKRSTARFVTLTGKTTLQRVLRQLFVLIPVIDDYKHYYIDEKEIEKLERYGEGWLDDHPLKEMILKQSLRFEEVYMLIDQPVKDKHKAEEPVKKRLNDMRYEKIIETIENLLKKETIVDLGSGEGKLSVRLGFIEGVKQILAAEPSQIATKKALERFEKAAKKESFLMPERIWSSLFYYDERLVGKDVMILCEVIEHIDYERLPKIMDTIFSEYKPESLIITTPNAEYNQVYELGDSYRHTDHRFELDRKQFQEWCAERSQDYPYSFTFEGIGEKHETLGAPTQLCLFTRKEERV